MGLWDLEIHLIMNSQAISSLDLLSLSGNVLCEQQCGTIKAALVAKSSALWLQWHNKNGDGSRKPFAASVISRSQVLGNLHPVILSEELHIAIFGNSRVSGDNAELALEGAAVFVTCSDGNVIAANPSLGLATISHAGQAVQWAGTITIEKSSCVIYICKSGTISIGKVVTEGKSESKTSLSWEMVSLLFSPITCYCLESTIIASDGSYSCVVKLSNSPQNKIELKHLWLPFAGVIRVTLDKRKKSRILLETCDGRSYVKSLQELIDSGKEGNTHMKSIQDKELPNSIEGVMNALRVCTEEIYKKGNAVNMFDTYIKQLSIAQRLVRENSINTYFNAEVNVHQISDQRGFVSGLLEFWSTSFSLQSEYWQLRVNIPQNNGLHHLCVKVPSIQSQEKFCVPLSFIKNNPICKIEPLEIMCSLVFQHFSNKHLFCVIPVCKVFVDIYHYLTPQRTIASKVIQSGLGNIKQGFFNKNINSELSEDKDNKAIIATSCESPVSFRHSPAAINVLSKVLHIPANNDNIKNDKTFESRLWYEQYSIDFKVSFITSTKPWKIFVTCNGSCPPLILCARQALVRRLMDLPAHSTAISLPSATLSEAHQMRRVIEYEASRATSASSLCHLHYTSSKCTSLIPL